MPTILIDADGLPGGGPDGANRPGPRRAGVLSRNGLAYTARNIDGLLPRRHENKKLLRAGKHPKGPARRRREQEAAFVYAREVLLKEK